MERRRQTVSEVANSDLGLSGAESDSGEINKGC